MLKRMIVLYQINIINSNNNINIIIIINNNNNINKYFN